MDHYLGAHASDRGGIDMAALRAGAAGMTALQIFTAIPTYYGDRTSIRPERVARFRDALRAGGIAPRHVISHAAYVLNVATNEEARYVRACAGLTKELERSVALGIGAVCFHPGAAKDGDREGAAERIGAAIGVALRQVEGPTRLLVENTAGAGTTMGRTAEEIAAILSWVPGELRARTGYGLDTCHLYAAGHDIAESEAALTGVLDVFQAVVGEAPAFFHLNDSEGALGSNKDRHALIGEGAIGAEPFCWLLRDRRTSRVPLILETPQQRSDVAEDDPSPDPNDVRMMEVLRGMAGRGSC
jgi:deoxyribonuclease-4